MYAFNSLNGAPAVALRRPATQQSTSGGGGRHSLGYRHEPSRRLDGGAAPAPLHTSSSSTLPAAWSDNNVVLPSTLPANRATHISSNHTIPEAQPQLRPSTRGCIGVSRELIPNGSIPNNTSPHHSTIREEAATNTTTNIDHRWMRTRPSTTTTTGTPPVTPREGGMVVLSARDAAAAAERDRHRAELDASWQKCTRLHTALQDQKLEAKRLSRELSCAAHMLIDRDEVVARQAITIDELTLRNTLLLNMLASWYACHPVCVVKEQVAAPPLPPQPPPPTDVVVVSSPPQIVVTIRDSQLLRALRAAESAVDSLKREVQKRDASWDVMEWDRRQLLAPPPSTTSSTIPVFLASTMPSGWATTAAASFSASGAAAAACSAGVEHHTISNKIGGNGGSEGGMSTALLLASTTSSEQRRRPMTQPGGTRRRPTR